MTMIKEIYTNIVIDGYDEVEKVNYKEIETTEESLNQMEFSLYGTNGANYYDANLKKY